ncbi:MAG TPA: methionine--tRNA ligase, partial [Actinobacteria bacterium]|nr:methionine--tRNA ligase [Actinomycetes bacterium]HEX21039.1 methionine--tRNA ligase [Actinomycetota bacterium]
ELMENFELRPALQEIWKLVAKANKFIDEAAPWALFKAQKDAQLREVIYDLAETIRIIAQLITPFMPATGKKIYEQLGLVADPSDIRFDSGLVWGCLRAGTKTNRAAPLFPRIEEKEKR